MLTTSIHVFFKSPVHPNILEQKVFESYFTSDKYTLKQVVNWLKQILDAIVYIHDEGFSHNYIKFNNILISDTGKAIVADFGFLTPAENHIKKSFTPMIYRCPRPETRLFIMD